MKNIELKVEVADFGDIRNRLKKNRASEKGILKQTDTYFNCQGKRLKMREENDKLFQLVLYERPDKKEAKLSNFETIDFTKQQAEALKTVLKKAYGEKVVIKKARKLWIWKNTRIHLDRVEKLGNFLELETAVKKDIASARKEYGKAVEFLDLGKYKKLKKSYSDILLAKKLIKFGNNIT